MEVSRLTRRPNPSRETTFLGVITNGDREKLIFPVQVTTSRIGKLTRLIHTLLYVMTIHAYIHTSYLFRETKFSGANGDIEKIVVPVKLTTSGIGNHPGRCPICYV